MSKYVNDVRSSSSDPRYMGTAFVGSITDAIKQAKRAKLFPLPKLKGKPRGMSRDRFALLKFLNLTKPPVVGYDAPPPMEFLPMQIDAARQLAKAANIPVMYGNPDFFSLGNARKRGWL